MATAWYVAIAALSVAQAAQAQPAPSRPSTPESWLQLRGGTDNSGVAPGSLDVEWVYKAPLPVRGISVAAGLAVLGSESATAHETSPSGDQRGMVTALDAATGKLLWSRHVETWIHGDVVIHRGRIYVTCGRWPMTYPGGVLALDARTGRTIWSYRTPSGTMPGAALDTVGGALIVSGGDGQLVALRLDDGKVMSTHGMGAANGMSSPRIDNGAVVVGASDLLLSYSLEDQRRTWTFRPRLRALGDVPVALSGNMVFTTGWKNVGVGGAFERLPVSEFTSLTKTAIQTRKLRGYKQWYHEQFVVAVNRRTGRRLWQQSLGIGLTVPRNQSGTPVVTGDRVIVSSPISIMMWSFDRASGDVRWSRPLEAMHKGAVTVAGKEIFFGDAKGNVTILRSDDGGVVGRCTTGSKFSVTGPVLVGRTVIAATHDGSVWATPYDSLRSRSVRNSKCFSTGGETRSSHHNPRG